MREFLILGCLLVGLVAMAYAYWLAVRADERDQQTDARNAECDRAIREQLDITIARGRLHG